MNLIRILIKTAIALWGIMVTVLLTICVLVLAYNLWLRIRYDRRVRTLSQQLVEKIHQAFRLSSPSDIQFNRNSFALLQSAIVYLDQAIQNQTFLSHEQSPRSFAASLGTSPRNLSKQSTLEEVVEPKLSATGEALIRLRDWLLVAKTREEQHEILLLESLDQKLVKILSLEGVEVLEEVDTFNPDHQQVIEVQPTRNQDKDGKIYVSLRPGYIFHSQIIRPQEVIVYQYGVDAMH